jgi:hypothetical protein
MYSFFEGASLKIANNLIQVTHMKESLNLFISKDISTTGHAELLKLVLALNACNLVQTMKEEFINQEIGAEDRQDVADDYVYESLRIQEWIKFVDGAEHMDKCLAILDISEKLGAHWVKNEDPTSPGPRYNCVKDVLRRLGNEKNHALQDVFFEFMYTQHGEFIKYFRLLLEAPMLEEPAPENLPSSNTGI